MNEPRSARFIAWFSCGAPSAVASKLAVEKHDAVVVCCDTRPSEHPDNYRFSAEIESWIGKPIVYIRNDEYNTVDDVFERERYMAGVRGARCTTELKKQPRMQFAAPDDTHVFGLCSDESKRIREFNQRNPDMKLWWVLQEERLTKQDCIGIVRMAGIQLPEMYRLGFDNNNCPGCVKASSPWYWDMIRTQFPEVFKRRCEQSREIGARLVEITHHNRIFLDELPPGPFPKIKEQLSCGPECGVQLNLIND